MKLVFKTKKGVIFRIPLTEKQIKLLCDEVGIKNNDISEFGEAKAYKVANYLFKNGRYVYFKNE